MVLLDKPEPLPPDTPTALERPPPAAKYKKVGEHLGIEPGKERSHHTQKRMACRHGME